MKEVFDKAVFDSKVSSFLKDLTVYKFFNQYQFKSAIIPGEPVDETLASWMKNHLY